MKMARIKNCDAGECAFNQENICHALSITVGGDGDHLCDTYCPASSKGGIPSATGMVGACKVTNCKSNHNFECEAGCIDVGHCGNEIDCLSYQQR